MSSIIKPAVVLNFACLVVSAGHAQAADKPTAYSAPEKVDEDFAFQGEYVGEAANGFKIGIQVIARGDGEFASVGWRGGLPGTRDNVKRGHEAEGKRDGDAVVLETGSARGVIRDGKLTVSHDGREFVLKKIERKSPTLGKKPPEGAVVLFDGSSADSFKNGKMTDDKLLMQGVTSKQLFGDCHVHVEFRLPYMPAARGQARGNSGCYLQGRYEVQMLDSFGLQGKDNECGGIYEIRDPDLNMCFPPLTWQTYDIDFTAARYDTNGEKLSPAKITVRHNGVLVHENVELPRSTRASPLKEGSESGPLYLQDHGNPVRYRNIWVVAK